ncbi:hypothetical protein PMIN03_004698 [Paraphaeosphaeria minitans]
MEWTGSEVWDEISGFPRAIPEVSVVHLDEHPQHVIPAVEPDMPQSSQGELPSNSEHSDSSMGIYVPEDPDPEESEGYLRRDADPDAEADAEADVDTDIASDPGSNLDNDDKDNVEKYLIQLRTDDFNITVQYDPNRNESWIKVTLKNPSAREFIQQKIIPFFLGQEWGNCVIEMVPPESPL